MLIRALIVLLVVLNLGAAAWWLTRPTPEPVPPADLPAGVARLQLVDEDAPAASATPSPAPATTPGVPAVCFSLGPFTSEAAATQARGALGGELLRVQLREAPGASASGYQVVMPPAASLEEAQATAARIGAAGFDDFLVVRQGEQANGIALGRYRSREAAERRLADLQAFQPVPVEFTAGATI